MVRDPLYLAVREYGKRSEGDQQRFTPQGPRDLVEVDYGAGGKPRSVANPPGQRVRKQMAYDPVVAPEQFEAARAVLDARSATQRSRRSRS